MMMPPKRLNLLSLGALLLFLGLLAGCSRAPDLVSAPSVIPSSILIRDVAVLDVEAGRVIPDRDVLIRGEFISEIGPADSLAGPPDAELIDGSGLTLLPGLVDTHTHVLSAVTVPWKPAAADPERNLESFLYSGVTTVFDTGSANDSIFELRDRVDQGEIAGPRIYAVGKTITAPDGHPVKMVESLAPWWIAWYIAPRIAYQIDSPESARAAVLANRDAGADFIKVVVDTLPGNAKLIDEDVLTALVEIAHENELRVVAHIGSTADALMAGRAGVDLYIHGVYMDRIPDEDVDTIAGFGIPMVPTIVVFDNAADISNKPFEPTRLEREVGPSWIFEAYNEDLGEAKVGPVMTDWLAHLREVRPDWDDNVSRLHRAGVAMITGSDFQPGLFPGPSLHRELDLLHKAGVPAVDVLRAATLHPARFLSGSDDPDFGSVQPGKRADLVLVGGDPIANLSAVHDVQDVIVGGVRLNRTGYPIGK